MVVRATTSTTATAPFNILDVYTGASVAYSLRKLRSGYSGAAIRIRRSTDNAEVDVPFDGVPIAGTSNLEDFLKSFTGGFGKNLLIYSDDLSTAEWFKVGAVTVGSNVDTSPDGSLTADKFIESTATERPRIRPPAVSVQNGKTYVFSFYAKPAGRKYLEINIFNFTTTTFVDIDAAVRVSGSTNVRLTKLPGGSGWTRVEVWGTFTQPTGGYRSDLYMSDTASNTAYTGDGTSGIIFSSFQVEEGNAATTYDYRFNSPSTGASAFVTTWYDQSGNGRNVTQATAASQPRIVNGGAVEKINGIPSARFNAQFLDSASNIPAPSGGLATLISVLPSVIGSYRGISLFSTLSENEYVRFAVNGFSYPFLGRTLRTELVNAGMPSSGALVFSHINNGSNHLLYRNKVLGATAALSGSVETSNSCALRIGAGFVSDGNYISENIIFPRVLTEQEKLSIENNAMSYYGIS